MIKTSNKVDAEEPELVQNQWVKPGLPYTIRRNQYMRAGPLEPSTNWIFRSKSITVSKESSTKLIKRSSSSSFKLSSFVATRTMAEEPPPPAVAPPAALAAAEQPEEEQDPLVLHPSAEVMGDGNTMVVRNLRCSTPFTILGITLSDGIGLMEQVYDETTGHSFRTCEPGNHHANKILLATCINLANQGERRGSEQRAFSDAYRNELSILAEAGNFDITGDLPTPESQTTSIQGRQVDAAWKIYKGFAEGLADGTDTNEEIENILVRYAKMRLGITRTDYDEFKALAHACDSYAAEFINGYNGVQGPLQPLWCLPLLFTISKHIDLNLNFEPPVFHETEEMDLRLVPIRQTHSRVAQIIVEGGGQEPVVVESRDAQRAALLHFLNNATGGGHAFPPEGEVPDGNPRPVRRRRTSF